MTAHRASGRGAFWVAEGKSFSPREASKIKTRFPATDGRIMRKFLIALCLLVPAALLGEDLHVAEVVRRGSPPYLESDRLYRIEGEGCANLRPGSLLQVSRGEWGLDCGTLVVIEVHEDHALGRLKRTGKTYPMKHDWASTPNHPNSNKKTITQKTENSQILYLNFNKNETKLTDQQKKDIDSLINKFKINKKWIISCNSNTNNPDKNTLQRTKSIEHFLISYNIKPETEIIITNENTILNKQIKITTRESYDIKNTDKIRTEKMSHKNTDHFFDFNIGLQNNSTTGTYSKNSESQAGTPTNIKLTNKQKSLFIKIKFTSEYIDSTIKAHEFSKKNQFISENDIIIDNTTYPQGTSLEKETTFKEIDVNLTIKIYKNKKLQTGIDFGTNFLSTKNTLIGQGYSPSGSTQIVAATTSADLSTTMPYIGVSGRFIFSQKVYIDGFFHISQLFGSNYRKYGLNMNYFPIKNIGISINAEKYHFSAPLDSISKTIAFDTRNSMVGLGLVFRY